jgi:hypothetical protein
MGATAVKKDVMVLLDAGVSMGFNLPNDLEVTAGTTTMFSAAISIISVFLDTLINSTDRVTIITFNSSTVAHYVLQPVNKILTPHFYIMFSTALLTTLNIVLVFISLLWFFSSTQLFGPYLMEFLWIVFLPPDDCESSKCAIAEN